MRGNRVEVQLLMIISALYILAIIVGGIETFWYPGISKNLIGIEAWLIVLGYGALLLTKLTRNSSKKFIRVNKIILIITILVMVVCQIVESLNYPNFLYSSYHLFHYNLILIFWISFLTVWVEGKNKIFNLSQATALTFFWLYFWPNDLFAKLACEDCLLENIQFGFYLPAGIVAIVISKLFSKKQILFKYLYILLGLGLIFVAFEEISWGQRLFKYNLEQIQTDNYKDEINLHNHNSMLKILNYLYIVVGLYGSLSYFFLKKYKWAKWISPSHEYIIYFLWLLVAYLRIFQIDGHYQDETGELFLSLGMFLFVREKNNPSPS